MNRDVPVDISGTIVVSPEPVTGAPKSVERLQAIRQPVTFLSNPSRRPSPAVWLEGTERLKTLLEVATGIYSEIGESKEVLFNTRAYACLRCLKNKA